MSDFDYVVMWVVTMIVGQAIGWVIVDWLFN